MKRKKKMELNKLHMLYGLKWNPFALSIPNEGLYRIPELDALSYRIRSSLHEGGFSLITGDPGTGKSCCSRLLCDDIAKQDGVLVTKITRPQSSITDLYRELSYVFESHFPFSNRFGGHIKLRDKWRMQMDNTTMKPVLIIDEAQDMRAHVMQEIKSLSSEALDSNILLTIILVGDLRLVAQLDQPELQPIRSRLRYRLVLADKVENDLMAIMLQTMRQAGCAQLMTESLVKIIVSKAMGNPRTMMTLANNCLVEAMPAPIGESVFFKVTNESLSVQKRPLNPISRRKL
jgi:general secretion pathway protein A